MDSVFSLETVNEANLPWYKQYENAFARELNQYQSRIYPSRDAADLCWYHIKAEGQYIGAIWLEKAEHEMHAVLGIFIADRICRNRGIGEAAIRHIIRNDLPRMMTDTVLLHVRGENLRAIACYQKVGFRERGRYCKNGINVIEMIYKCDKI